MKNSRFLLGIVVLFFLLGCSQYSGEYTENAVEEKTSMELLSAGELIAFFDLKEDDTFGYDIQDFIEMYQINQERVKKIKNIHALLENYKTYIDGKRMELNDYCYLSTQDAYVDEIEAEEYGDVKVVAFHHQSGNYLETFIIDTSKNMGYYAENSDLLEEGGIPTHIKKMENTGIFVEELLEQGKVCEWKSTYAGESEEGTTGNFGWALYIELSDSRIVRYLGYGLGSTAAPADLSVVVSALKTGMKE